MANQNPFSLVRRLTSTILILLLVLLVIQIAGTLWGRYVVTQELYSSTQNNVNYLRDTFEENVRQIQREMTNQLFYQASPQLITFYTQLRKGAFSTNAHYHWELNQLKLELNVVQQMNAMIDGMDIYFPKLGSALSVSQGAISPNAVADEDIQNVYAAFQGTGFRLTRIDDAFFIPCHYPVHSGLKIPRYHPRKADIFSSRCGWMKGKFRRFYPPSTPFPEKTPCCTIIPRIPASQAPAVYSCSLRSFRHC